jgi:hypothetical protein
MTKPRTTWVERILYWACWGIMLSLVLYLVTLMPA